MQKRTRSELQMLREIAWLLLPDRHCTFCGKLLLATDNPRNKQFGNRRHGPVPVELTTHHEDYNRDNNDWENLALVHTNCHKVHHAARRKKVQADETFQNQHMCNPIPEEEKT